MFETVQYVQRVVRSVTVRNTFWVGSASFTTMIMNALGTMAFVRILGVTDFGIYTLIISLSMLLVDFSELGIGSSIVRFGAESVRSGNTERFRTIIATLLRYKIIMCLAILSLSLLFGRVILEYTFQHVDERISSFFMISLLPTAVGMIAVIFIPIYHSFQKFQLYALLTTARSAVKFVLILGSVYLFSTFTIPIGLFIELAAVVVLVALSMVYTPFKDYTLRISDRAVPGQFFKFSKWISLSTAIYILSTRVDILYVGFLSNAHALGLYSAASKIAGLVIILANSYWTVLLAEVSTLKDPEAILAKQRMSLVIVLLLAAGIGLLAALAPQVIHVFFGTEFSVAGPILRTMTIGLVCTVLCYPTNATLFALNKTVVFPIISALSIISFIIANALLIPVYGISGAGMAFAINGIVSLLTSVILFATIGIKELRIRKAGADAAAG